MKNRAKPRASLSRVVPTRRVKLAPVLPPKVTTVTRHAPIPFPETAANSYERPDSLSLYMREVGEVGLLTPQEEVMLAKRIKRGDNKARDRMIRANLRLVVKIAREYEGYGLPLLDLINEGNMGLMRAVEKFDPAKGGKLSTYSSWWIKQSIRRGIANQAKTVRLPIHVLDKLSKLKRATTKLQDELGQEPTDEDLAEELGITVKRTIQLRNTTVRTSSLDATIGEDDSGKIGDLIADDRAENPYHELEKRTMHRLLDELIGRLPDREIAILRMRFGLDGNRELSLEDIGRQFGVTRERIRQLQNLALAKLRKMIEARDAITVAA
ncbi:MAG: RNA polymerase sigma factor RpoD/SigA [Verrucomicrobiota bacterium]